MATTGERTRVVLSVPSIRCGHCVKTITRELKQLDGVVSVEGSVEKQQVAVEFTGDALPKIKATMSEVGYPVVG